MSNVAIITDTNSGYTVEQAQAAGVYLMAMPFYVDGLLQYEGVDLTQDEFYKKLEADVDVTTSMPIVGDVISMWDKILEDYDELVYIPMSGGLSASCETARVLAQDYDGRVEVVDNHRIAPTQKLSVVEAKKLADEGKSAKEIRVYLEETMNESSIYIMVDTLKYLKKGGRLTPAVAAIGTLLKIKPVLQIQGGKLDTFAKARTLKQAKQIMLDAIKEDITKRFASENGEGIVISVSHTQSPEEAELFREEILALYPNRQIIIDPLALSIACHIGPGALAVTVSKSFVTEI